MKVNEDLRMIHHRILLSAWIVILLVACGSKPSLPVDLLGVEVQEEEINNRIHMYTPRGINTFKTNESVEIALDGTSEDPISIYYDNIKMFIMQEKQWIEVDNFAKQHPNQTILLPNQGNNNNTELLGVRPILPDPSQPVILRVVIIGHIMNGGVITDEITVDYIDVKLEP